MPEQAKYPPGLPDGQWELVKPALARNAISGRATRVDLREVVNAILRDCSDISGQRQPLSTPGPRGPIGK